MSLGSRVVGPYLDVSMKSGLEDRNNPAMAALMLETLLLSQ